MRRFEEDTPLDPAQEQRLNSLFPEAATKTKPKKNVPKVEIISGYALIERSKIERWANNPRGEVKEDDILDLREAISANGRDGLDNTGLEEALTVRPHPDGSDRYLLIDGERRWKACEIWPHKKLPCMVRMVTSEGEAMEISLAIQLQRESLSPLQEGIAIKKWLAGWNKEGKPYTYRTAPTEFGKGKGYLENRVRLVDAGPDVQKMVSLRNDTLSHGLRIDKVREPRLRKRLIKIALEGASVKEIQAQIDEAAPKHEAAQGMQAQGTQEPPAAPLGLPAHQGYGMHTPTRSIIVDEAGKPQTGQVPQAPPPPQTTDHEASSAHEASIIKAPVLTNTVEATQAYRNARTLLHEIHRQAKVLNPSDSQKAHWRHELEATRQDIDEMLAALG